MNPWTPIGWIVLVALCIVIGAYGSLLFIGLYMKASGAIKMAPKRLRHWRCRNIAPQIDQRWIGADGIALNVKRVDTLIHYNWGSGGWNWEMVSPRNWRSFAREHLLYLPKDPT